MGIDGYQRGVHCVCAQPWQGLVRVDTPAPGVAGLGPQQQNVAIGDRLELLDLPVRHARHPRFRLLRLGLVAIDAEALGPGLLLDLLDHLLPCCLGDPGNLQELLEFEFQCLLLPMVEASSLLPRPSKEGDGACSLRVRRARDQRKPKLATLRYGLPKDRALQLYPGVILRICEDALGPSLFACSACQSVPHPVHRLEVKQHQGLTVLIADLLGKRDCAVQGHHASARPLGAGDHDRAPLPAAPRLKLAAQGLRLLHARADTDAHCGALLSVGSRLYSQ
mmetsp:Transcript_48318/g.134317  ORF Transcript_48318/g.134317 Transcript_48318/m.134317 type:complete len:279 (+) Transcript_48318:384-1220(+)